MSSARGTDREATRLPWLGVEVRHLATLGAVERTRSFREAARELGYAQSAVSQHIARLERVVGAQLVVRRQGRRTVQLTRAGHLLATRGEHILSELRAARFDLSGSDKWSPGVTRVAVASDVAPLLTRLLSSWRAHSPRPAFQVADVPDDAQLAVLLQRGEADIAVGMQSAGSGIASMLLTQDPFILLVRPGSVLAAAPVVTEPAELLDQRLIVPASVLSRGHLRAPALRRSHVIRVPFAAAIAGLVAQGHGVGLLPRSVAEPAPPDLVRVPTAALIAPQPVRLAWRAARRQTPRVQAFCDAAVCAFPERDHAIPPLRA